MSCKQTRRNRKRKKKKKGIAPPKSCSVVPGIKWPTSHNLARFPPSLFTHTHTQWLLDGPDLSHNRIPCCFNKYTGTLRSWAKTIQHHLLWICLHAPSDYVFGDNRTYHWWFPAALCKYWMIATIDRTRWISIPQETSKHAFCRRGRWRTDQRDRGFFSSSLPPDPIFTTVLQFSKWSFTRAMKAV